MRIGIISDVHSNLYALMEVYSEFEKEGIDTVICLGDIVGYGPHPNEVINFIKRKQIISIKGIYDIAVVKNDINFIKEGTINNFSLEFTRNELTKNNLYYLSNLPDELLMKFGDFKIRFIHKNPYSDFKDIEEDILVCGYTHFADESKVSENKFVLNPGSVGKPYNGNGIVTFGILDVSDTIYKFKTMDISYSFNKIQKDMKMMNFPEILINFYENEGY